MNITSDQVLQACPTATRLDDIVPQINELCPQYSIDTPSRLAMFVAQCLHESGGFHHLKEIWGPTSWQKKYENNLALGNSQPGDGRLFAGTGLIQLTGRYNFQKFSDWVQDPEIMTNPTLLAQPRYAVLSAIYFWSINNLNNYADAGDIVGCTRRINGKQCLGLEERKKYYNVLLAVLSAVDLTD